MLKKLLVLSLLIAAPTVAMADDLKKGKKAFRPCKACHAVGEKAKNKVGPQLNGIIGRVAGAVEGFNYSDAIKNSGITWDEANLDEYIANPKKKIPGNKMVYVGLKSEKKRKALIAYLASFGADGKQKAAEAAPAEAAPAAPAEAAEPAPAQ